MEEAHPIRNTNIQRWASKHFCKSTNRKSSVSWAHYAIANPQFLGLITQSQIRSFLGSLRNRKVRSFLGSLRIPNPQFLGLIAQSQISSFLGSLRNRKSAVSWAHYAIANLQILWVYLRTCGSVKVLSPKITKNRESAQVLIRKEPHLRKVRKTNKFLKSANLRICDLRTYLRTAHLC